MVTINDIIARLPPSPDLRRIQAPAYTGVSSKGVGLAVESMKRHTSDEGWQIFAGLQHAGYELCGARLDPPYNMTRVPLVLANFVPGVVVMQDQREWDNAHRDFRDPHANFRDHQVLAQHPDVFKLTILKDSHQRPGYHRESAESIGCHAWIVYYHPRIVTHLAPYVRPEHIVRVYHTIDPAIVPEYSPEGRSGCLLSGAVSRAYPWRQLLVENVRHLPETTLLPHPGYHRRGCVTPEFLKTLTRYKVAICTASMYGYALRKIVEATASGAIVISDLPQDERLPMIDENIVRVPPGTSPQALAVILSRIYRDYDAERQAWFAAKALEWYDFREAGCRLVADIEKMRTTYNLKAVSA